MRKILILLIILFSMPVCFAQSILRGTVSDSLTGKRLQSASVYINNSSIGITTDENGYFLLHLPAKQRCDLLVSMIGYTTYARSVLPEELSMFMNIKIVPRSAEMEMVIVHTYEKDGWTKWGKVFTDNLLGTIPAYAECEIINKQAIRFVYNKSTDILGAYASEPLIIKNKYLGYRLQYDLQSFSADFKNMQISFTGYPLFKEMEGNAKKQEKWARRRLNTYEGSMMHFMRSLFLNRLKEEGFTVNNVIRDKNYEKLRVQKFLKEMKEQGGNEDEVRKDSMKYYRQVLEQTDSLNYLLPEPLTISSITGFRDSVVMNINFKNYLRINYDKEKEMPAESSLFSNSIKQKPSSLLRLLNSSGIVVYANGSYYDPQNLFAEEYWSRSEKLASLLPTDYQPH